MSTQPDIAISEADWAIVRDILNKYVPGYSVWAFGSRATHAHKPFSDLDIAIVGDKPLAIASMASLRDAFIESDLPWKVDVVDWATITEAFRSHIDAHKIPLQ